MRLKLGLLAIFLIGFGVGIPYYLDSQIPRATATVQVHPSAAVPIKGFTSSYMENEFELILANKTLTLAATTLEIPTQRQEEAVALMKENVEAYPVRGTDFIEITAKYPDRLEAINTANAVAQAYAQRRSEMHYSRIQKALTALDEELKDQEAVVKKCREKLIPLIGSYGIPDFGDVQAPAGPPSIVHSEITPTISPKPEMSLTKYNQAKEAYDQSRILLREMIIKQKEARFHLLTPHSPVAIHEYAR